MLPFGTHNLVESETLLLISSRATSHLIRHNLYIFMSCSLAARGQLQKNKKKKIAEKKPN